MEIGEKIRHIRTLKCMTQSQLAGDYITRNMLSRIENGAAQPSLRTVDYIAQRLKVPVGYLLARENEDRIYKKIFNIDNIKRAFKDGDYRICRDICKSADFSDDELNLIVARCSSGIAKEEFFSGKLRSSVRYFEESIEYNSKTLYTDQVINSEAFVYFRYLRSISPTLTLDITDTKTCDGLSMNDRICEYILALEKMEYGSMTAEEALNSYGIDPGSPLALHIQARESISRNNYQKAYQLLKQIFNLQERIADPVLYNVFYDLEICSREMNDYRGAYEYSADKVNLLERMLAEAEEV